MDIYQLEEKLVELLGVGVLMSEILKALSNEQRKDILEYIARMYDIQV